MGKTFLAIVMILAAIFSTSALAGAKYRGAWGGKAKSSIEFVSSNPLTVKYCYIDQCSVLRPQGTMQEMEFIFPVAKMTLKKSGKRYYGIYKQINSSEISKATFVLQNIRTKKQ